VKIHKKIEIIKIIYEDEKKINLLKNLNYLLHYIFKHQFCCRSYSLSGPADPNSPPPATAHLGSSDIMMSCGGFGSDASDLLTIGSQRLNGSAFASLIQQNNTKKNI
jgi:hypothetical protein